MYEGQPARMYRGDTQYPMEHKTTHTKHAETNMHYRWMFIFHRTRLARYPWMHSSSPALSARWSVEVSRFSSVPRLCRHG